MKQYFLTTLILILFSTSCSKSKNDPQPDNLPTSSETKPQYNNTSFGVYKGVVLGSTGTIVLRINNGDTIVKAYLSISNTKDTLSTTQPLSAGQPIVNLLFTGRVSSLSFSANADGSNAVISNLNITGHPNAAAIIIHENSTQQVLCYEGTFSGGLTGNLCFIKFGSYNVNNSTVMKHVARITNDSLTSYGEGKYFISDTSNYTHGFFETGSTVRSFNGRAKLNGNSLTGVWTAWWPGLTVNGYNGSFVCNRTY